MITDALYFAQIYDKNTGQPISPRVPCRVVINDDNTFTILDTLELNATEDSSNPVLRWFTSENAIFYYRETALEKFKDPVNHKATYKTTNPTLH